MRLPISKGMMVQSRERNLSIDFFTDEQVNAINTEITKKIINDSRRYEKHKRYFLLVEFLFRTGARIDEALLIKPCDVNLATNSIKLKTLKQGKDKKTEKPKERYRIIPIHPELRDVYMQYLIDNNINQKSEDLLFPMSRQAVDLYLKYMQKKLGFKIHAHKFRHTFAVKAIMGNVPLNVLQQWMGHSSVFTTSIYTQITGMDTSEFMGRVI